MLPGQRSGGSSLDSASSQISPGAGVSISSSGTNPIASLSAVPTAASGAATPIIGPAGGSPLNLRGAPPASASPAGGQDNPPGGSLFDSGAKPPGGGAILQNVRITADVTNNAVLVYANQESQRVVEQTIRQIDRPQRQIAIEATIAEVTLNDQLNYGVQFFLASQKGSISNTIATAPGAPITTIEPASNAVNAAAGALLGRAIPGFNLLIGSENSPPVILDAPHHITDPKMLSDPPLVGLGN